MRSPRVQSCAATPARSIVAGIVIDAMETGTGVAMIAVIVVATIAIAMMIAETETTSEMQRAVSAKCRSGMPSVSAISGARRDAIGIVAGIAGTIATCTSNGNGLNARASARYMDVVGNA